MEDVEKKLDKCEKREKEVRGEKRGEKGLKEGKLE